MMNLVHGLGARWRSKDRCCGSRSRSRHPDELPATPTSRVFKVRGKRRTSFIPHPPSWPRLGTSVRPGRLWVGPPRCWPGCGRPRCRLRDEWPSSLAPPSG